MPGNRPKNIRNYVFRRLDKIYDHSRVPSQILVIFFKFNKEAFPLEGQLRRKLMA
jgi:hypothetical protein